MSQPHEPAAIELVPDARRALLTELKRAGRATIPQLAATLSVSTEAIRQQLSQLQRDGWVIADCSPEETLRSPGRPAATYCLSSPGHDLFVKRYAALALTWFDELPDAERTLTDFTDLRVDALDSKLPAAPLGKRIAGLRSIYADDDPHTDLEKSDRGFRLIERNCPYLRFALERPLFCSTTVSSLRRLTGCEVVREERFQDGDEKCIFHIYADAPVTGARKRRRFEREPEKGFRPPVSRPLGRSLLLALIFLIAVTSATADVFRILDDPRDAAQARVDLIQQARSEINALYFLARNDRITLCALALLRDARRRGVNVRLIVDANFQHIPKAVLAYLRDEGVRIRVYHPLTIRHPSWLFRRMHEKVVAVDAERYIAGGRNLAESYFGLARKNYVDRDVYVEGPSAAEADRHFENLWSSGHVAELSVHVSVDEKRRAAQWLDDAVDQLECRAFIQRYTNHDWSAGERVVAAVGFLHDDRGARVGARFADILHSARRSIVIESPYLVPSRSLLQLLEKKVGEGVYVEIVTNSLRSSDGVLVHAAYLKYRRRLARAGIDVHEYKGPDTLHAKSAVVDGRIVLVGSYNIDPRSQNLNSEVICVVEDEEIARELLDAIDLHVLNAWKVDRDGQPACDDSSGIAPRSKLFRAWSARLLLPLIEGQL
jgi:putative cardiolipin synthase